MKQRQMKIRLRRESRQELRAAGFMCLGAFLGIATAMCLGELKPEILMSISAIPCLIGFFLVTTVRE